MSASPTTQPANSAKRPLEETSSPTRSNDQPDAKRPALDKILKNDDEVVMAEKPTDDDDLAEAAKPTTPPAEEKTNGSKAEEDDDAAASEDAKPVPAVVPSVATPDVTNPATHDETAWIHIRAVISSPEAATIIGKGGENVSNIRKLSGAKCTVSDYQKGAVERILTVSGVVDAAAKVRRLIACATLYLWA
jgi:poly(rC)-binding protein 2/3/4